MESPDTAVRRRGGLNMPGRPVGLRAFGALKEHRRLCMVLLPGDVRRWCRITLASLTNPTYMLHYTEVAVAR